MRVRLMAFILMSAATTVTLAKLPPPTPEEAQAAVAKKEQEQANLEKERVLLDKAQDRVVEHYKRTKGAAAAGAGRGVQADTKTVSQKAVEPAGTAGPQRGKDASAEAHSTPAK
jgi:hypothetical protein